MASKVLYFIYSVLPNMIDRWDGVCRRVEWNEVDLARRRACKLPTSNEILRNPWFLVQYWVALQTYNSVIFLLKKEF
jgi:hypothetical protein